MKTTLDDWVPAAYQAGYEVVWLPLNRGGLNDIKRNVDNLESWFETVDGLAYSPVKDFLASFDHPTQGLPAPFTTEGLPIYLRMWMAKKSKSNFTLELLEAMGFRFSDQIDDRRISRHQLPDSFEEALSFSAIDLNMSLQELLALPEKDEWRYEAHGGAEAFTPASFVAQAL